MAARAVTIAALALAACRQAGTDERRTFTQVDAIDLASPPPEAEALLVHGSVVAGSLVHRVQGTTEITRFALERHGHRVDAQMVGPVPDLVRDRAELLVDAHLVGGVLRVRYVVNDVCWPKPGPPWCDP
jgi:hypothetical protein